MLYTHFGKLISSITKVITRIPIPKPLRTPVLSLIAKGLKIKLIEAQYPVSHYKSINALFTRTLKSDLRPIGSADLVSPCDGRILEFGDIQDAQLIQAKGVHYSIDQLLQERGQAATDLFINGSFITLYLSPSDCHLVKSPTTGNIITSRHIPGALYPVREPYISHFPGLYTKNERVISYIQTPDATIAVVLVAAINVGCMTLDYPTTLDLTANQITQETHAPAINIQKGDPLGTFHLGSTVVILSSKKLSFNSTVSHLQWVQYGTNLGQYAK